MTFMPVDVLIDQKTKQRHRIDTLNLLAYVALLVLVLVTTWFFKRRATSHIKCHLHETGLAIIYGLVMGAGLRYFGLEVTISSIALSDTLPRSAPVDYITLASHNLGDKSTNQTHVYAYEFRGEIQQSAKLGSQISYASVDPEVFFNIILPPIVLNAGLSLKRRHFFRNIGAIFSYAFVGTTISVASVGAMLYGFIHGLKALTQNSYLADQFSLANCLYFGAIISPTDPLAVLAIFQELGVDVNLFALVFGESILNDAVSIVLTHSIDHFSVIYGRDSYYSILRIIWLCFYNFLQMFLASCSIGVLFGIATALTTKFTKLTESPLLESSLVVLMSYSAFLFAEVLDMSGIVAILMCGITQAHYTINNLSFEARERLKNLFELLTFLCESFLFLAVGVCFWQRGQTWNWPFIGMAFIAITIARALSVYPLTVLLNLGRRQKIPMNYQHLITWGGAARGVISYSLAARNTVGDARRIMLSTTSVIVIVTVIAVGGAVVPLLKRLAIPFGPDAGKQKRRAIEGKRAAAAAASAKQLECGAHDDQAEEQELGDENERSADAYEENEIVGADYHATNNPAWLVRPKRLRWHSASSSAACRRHHHCGNHRKALQQHHQQHQPGGQLLAIGGATDSLACSTPSICRVSKWAARSYLARPNQQAHSRCCCCCCCCGRHERATGGRALEQATPVLEIWAPGETAPSVAACTCTCACDCSLVDSRDLGSCSSCVAHVARDPAGQLFMGAGRSATGTPLAKLSEPSETPGAPPPAQFSERNDEATAERLNADGASIAESNATSATMNHDGQTDSTLELAPQRALATTVYSDHADELANGARRASSFQSATIATETENALSCATNQITPYENASLVRRWRNIDNYFIKPLLTNSQPTLLDTMPSALRAFARLFTSDEQLMRRR